MPVFSFKKTPSASLVIFLGWVYISFLIFEKLHSLRPPTITPLYLILDDVLPAAFYTLLLSWGLACSSARGFLPGFTVFLVFFYWVDGVGSSFKMMGKSTLELHEMVHNFSAGEILFWFLWLGLTVSILYFLTGWNFYKKRPWFFPYTQADPLQNVLMKFVGILWMLMAFYKAFEISLSLLAFRSHLM